jgi:hypothetical protein
MNAVGSFKGSITIVSPGILAKGTIVTLAGVAASATVPGAGVVRDAVVEGDMLVIDLFGGQVSKTVLASGAIAAGAIVGQTASGKAITDPAAGTVLVIGFALTAAADGELFELNSVPPSPCKYS